MGAHEFLVAVCTVFEPNYLVEMELKAGAKGRPTVHMAQLAYAVFKVCLLYSPSD